jgi:putative membrane protein
MEANAPQAGGHRFNVEATANTHFAWIRTRLALERTMMAWVRTATALIGFGFTIVQFFERLNNIEGVDPATRPFAARYVGLVLIAAGIIALLVSAFQYRAAIAGVGKAPGSTPVYAISIGLILIGVFAFLAVLVRAV